MSLIEETNESRCTEENHFAGSLTHIIPEPVPPPPFLPTDTSDYETDSSISSSHLVAYAKSPDERNFFGITYNRFKNAIKIKRKYTAAKLTYFLFYSARSLYVTYYMLFLTSVGLNPRQAGIIQGVRMGVITFSAIFWGLLADRSKKYLLIMCIKLIGFSLIVFLNPWIAYWINTNIHSEHEHRQHIKDAVTTSLNMTNISLPLSEIMTHSNAIIKNMFELEWSPSHYKTGSAPLFISILSLGIGSAFFGGATHTLLDTKIIQMTKSNSKSKATYGRQRLWGSVAYSVIPVLCGTLLESVPDNHVSKYMPIFYCHITFLLLGLISYIVLYKQKSSQTPAQHRLPDKPAQQNDEENICYLLKRMFKSIHMMFFFLNVFFVGIGNGLHWNFQFLLMQEMNASKTTMGLCLLTQCATETVIFPFASNITKKIGGKEIAKTLGLLGYAVLFLAFALCENPKMFMLATCAVGATFPITYTASMDELYSAGNPKCINTLYAVFNSILTGVGSGTACILGGIVYKSYGGKTLYLGVFIVYTILVLLSIIYAFIYKKCIEFKWNAQCQKVYEEFSDPESIYSGIRNESLKIIPDLQSDEAISLTIEFETAI